MDIAVSIFIALIPGLAWLFFYLQEAPHPEPKGLILAAFISGAAFSFAALIVQILIQNSKLLPSPTNLSSAASSPILLVIAILAFAFVEEFFKFMAAWMTVHDKPDFDEPVDAMIYSVVAALGFATVENLGSITPSPGHSFELTFIAEVISLRFIGATLLHTLASGVVGYYWAMGIARFKDKKYIVLGLVLGTILHASFNFLIINYGNLIYTVIFVIVVGLFVIGDFEKLKQRLI